MSPEQEARRYVARLEALSGWMRKYDFATCPSEDEKSTFLIRDIDGKGEVIAITEHIGDTATEGELLREQAQGMRALARAGLTMRVRFAHAELWRPGEMHIYDGGEEVLVIDGGETWNDVIRAAVEWLQNREIVAGRALSMAVA